MEKKTKGRDGSKGKKPVSGRTKWEGERRLFLLLSVCPGETRKKKRGGNEKRRRQDKKKRERKKGKRLLFVGSDDLPAINALKKGDPKNGRQRKRKKKTFQTYSGKKGKKKKKGKKAPQGKKGGGRRDRALEPLSISPAGKRERRRKPRNRVIRTRGKEKENLFSCVKKRKKKGKGKRKENPASYSINFSPKKGRRQERRKESLQEREGGRGGEEKGGVFFSCDGKNKKALLRKGKGIRE